MPPLRNDSGASAMNKRTFIKLFAATVASPSVMRMLAWVGQERLKNWAGNLEYNTDRLHTSISLEQVQDYVKKESKLKVLGTRHCFNNIADSKDGFLSLKPMDKVVAIDTAKRTVTVGAGITYGQLCPYLDGKGFALHNLASLPHISIAGACSTATHGSGQKNGNLATAASALEIVTADGKVVNLSREREDETFNGAVVGLGALGVITKVTLDIQPSFRMRQYVYENLPLSELKDHFDAIKSSGYSISLFTDWQKQRINEVWIKRSAASARTRDRARPFARYNSRPIMPQPGGDCERGQRTAIRIFRSTAARGRSDSGDGAYARSSEPVSADFRNPYDRRRQLIDEPLLQSKTAWRSTSPGNQTGPRSASCSPSSRRN